MIAGPLFGLAASIGYRSAYAMSAVLCLVGLLLLMSVRRRAVVG